MALSRRTQRVTITLDARVYEMLEQEAQRLGLTIESLARLIIETYTLWRNNALEERIAELEDKYHQLAIEVGRIEKDLIWINRALHRRPRHATR